jgi:TolB-like protein
VLRELEALATASPGPSAAQPTAPATRATTERGPIRDRRVAVYAGAALLPGLLGLLGYGAASRATKGRAGAARTTAAGMTEELITVLSRVEGLRVPARTSVFALKGKNLDVRTIGDTLRVAAVLEGSVRRAGDRLRLTAQLLDTKSGYHLWSDEYDRELKDVFDQYQDELARHRGRPPCAAQAHEPSGHDDHPAAHGRPRGP